MPRGRSCGVVPHCDRSRGTLTLCHFCQTTGGPRQLIRFETLLDLRQRGRQICSIRDVRVYRLALCCGHAGRRRSQPGDDAVEVEAEHVGPEDVAAGLLTKLMRDAGVAEASAELTL